MYDLSLVVQFLFGKHCSNLKRLFLFCFVLFLHFRPQEIDFDSANSSLIYVFQRSVRVKTLFVKSYPKLYCRNDRPVHSDE